MVEAKIIEILADNLGTDASGITGASTFTDLGLDSLDMVDLLMTLEDEFGVEVEPSEELTTVASVATKVEELKVN